MRFHKQVDVFGRPIAPCIYDMNQFQGKIQKKLQAQMLLQLSSHHQSARPFLCCTLAASPPCPFPSPGHQFFHFFAQEEEEECEILEGERDEEAEAEEAEGKKEEFPEINETCWAQEPQMLLAWQKFGVRIQSIGLDAGKGSLLFGTKHPKVVAIASPWDI